MTPTTLASVIYLLISHTKAGSICHFKEQWEFQSHKYKDISDLGRAAAEDDVKAIQKAVEFGCSTTNNNTKYFYKFWGYKSGFTPLHIASTHGANEAVKKILSIGKFSKLFETIDARDEFGATAVYAAAYFRYSATVKILHKAGANISIPNNNGATPLYVAAQNGHLHTVKTLVKLGADINQGLDDGATPLISASSKGHVGVAKFLVEQCADINIKGGTTTSGKRTNMTAMDWARNLGHNGVLKVLEKRQNDPTACKKPLATTEKPVKPLPSNCPMNKEWEFQNHTYRHISFLGMSAAMDDVEAMKEAIAQGCTITSNDTEFYYRHWGFRRGFTPLHVASTHGANEAVSLLLNYENFFNNFVDARDDLGATPVYAAAYWRYSTTVMLLEEAGANISIPNVRGATPLYVAAQNGHLHTVQALISLGADIDQGKDSGATPLYIASEQGHDEVVDYLVNMGADIKKHSKTTLKTPLIAALTQHHQAVVEILRKAQKEQNLDEENDTLDESVSEPVSQGNESLTDSDAKPSALIVSLTLIVMIMIFGLLYMFYRIYKKNMMDDDKIELIHS